MIRIPLARLLLLALLLLPACVPPMNRSSESVEQTQDSPASSEAPALERKLHLANLGVLRSHQNGQRGQGIKIAVLDSGFRDYRQFLGKGLPAKVTVRSFRSDRNLVHICCTCQRTKLARGYERSGCGQRQGGWIIQRTPSRRARSDQRPAWTDRGYHR